MLRTWAARLEVKNGGYQDEIFVPLLALKLGRPMKWAETRVEHLRTARQGRDQIHYIDVAVKKDGTVIAVRDKIIADMGCSYGVDNSISSAALYMPGVYQIQDYKVDAYGIATNKANHGSLRGIGKAEAAFVIERTMVDIIARELNMDPVELRNKNFIPPEAFPYRNVTGALYDSGRYEECLKQALELAKYEEAKEEKKRVARPRDLPRCGRGFGHGADQFQPASMPLGVTRPAASNRTVRDR